MFGSAPTESKRSELSLRDVLGGSEQQANKNQQALRDEFKAFLHGQPNNQGGVSGGFNDPVQTSRGDFTRQPLNPTVGRAPEIRNDTFGGQADSRLKGRRIRLEGAGAALMTFSRSAVHPGFSFAGLRLYPGICRPAVSKRSSC